MTNNKELKKFKSINGSDDIDKVVENPYRLVIDKQKQKHKGTRMQQKSKPHTLKGMYVFIVKYYKDGYAVFLEKERNAGHVDITRGRPVNYAGEIQFGKKGELLLWNNRSGHYKPDPEYASEIALATILPYEKFQPFETSANR